MQDMWPSGPVGDLCERKTEGQDRIQHGTASTDGKILCQKRYPMFVGNADGFAECAQQSTGWQNFDQDRVQCVEWCL